MAIRYYDEAFVNKLKNWTNSTNLTIVGPSESARLFETIADKSNDSPIKLPLISLKRNLGFNILNPNKKPLTFDGIKVESNIKKSIQLNGIPVEIPYQLDIYTRYFEEADEYVRNIIFNIVNYPKLTINIPYNDEHIEHDSNIRLANEVTDNSEIPERLISGQFTRLTLNVNIDDAYLWDVRVRDNYCIDADVIV